MAQQPVGPSDGENGCNLGKSIVCALAAWSERTINSGDDNNLQRRRIATAVSIELLHDDPSKAPSPQGKSGASVWYGGVKISSLIQHRIVCDDEWEAVDPLQVASRN
jgi:hypothetical protein